MPLDADSIDYLDDVKKGKPRRFVMICKGVRIMSLVVYKKGSLERYKKQAKEEGKGQFYHGVVDGKGLNIAFKLCRVDGYDKPPGKELILKDYLSTETGIRFKPVYKLVEVLPEVNEQDEIEGSEVEGEQQETPPTAPPMPEAGTWTAEDLAAECKRLKAALYPQVKIAVAAHPDQKDAIIRLLVSADNNEKAKEFAAAIKNYEQLSAVLTSLPDAEEEKDEKEEEEATEDPAVLFNERLRALLTDLKAAAGTPAGDEAKLKISEAGVLAKKKDFVRANALLEQAHEILNDWAAEAGEDPAVVFNERLKALLPDIKAAAGTLAGSEAKRLVNEAGGCARNKDFAEANSLLDEAHDILIMHADVVDTDVDPAVLFNDKLRALLLEVKAAAGTPAYDAAKLKVSEAGVFAKKKDFSQANALLDDAEAALHGVGESTSPSSGRPADLSSIAPGIVAKRTFLLERWKPIPEQISADLKGLRQAIEREIPDEDANLLIELSEDYLTDFCDDMKESIDNDINSGDAQYKNAIKTIQAFRTKISSDELIQHLMKNTLKADVGIDSILLNALAEVEQALAS